MIRILLVDDQKSVRAKIQYLLESEADLEIVGFAENGYDAISLVNHLQPDVVLIDIEMPGLDGITVTKEICHQNSNVKVLVLSSYDSSNYINQAMSVGAYGYILKTTPGKELANVIRSVYQGYSQLGPGLLAKIITQVPETTATNSPLEAVSVQPNLEPINSTSPLFKINQEEYIPNLSWLIRFGGFLILAIIALGVGLASVFEYKKVVKAPAVARPQGEIRLVQAPISGRIADLTVTANQTVKKGEILAKIDDSSLKTERVQLQSNIDREKLQIDQIQAQIKTLETQIEAQTNASDRGIKTIIADLETTLLEQQQQEIALKTQIEEAKASLQASEAALDAARVKSQRLQTVAEAGAISQTQYEQAQLEAQQSQQEVIANQAKLNRAQNDLTSHIKKIAVTEAKINEEIEQQKSLKLATLANLQQEKAALIQQQIQAQNQLTNYQQELNRLHLELDKTQVTAPVAGTISKLNIRNLDRQVALGEEIASIAPSDYPIVFKAMVSGKERNQVRSGQTVQLKIAACPYSDYGILEGKITTIAPDSINSGTTENSLPTGETFYEANIEPQLIELKDGDKICSIEPGMNANANIITQQETLLKFVLRKVIIGLDF